MKAKVYTTQELYNLSTAQLEKAVKTQAERFNKQITRANKAGLDTTTISKSDKGSLRVSTGFKQMQKGKTENAYRNALVEQYKDTVTRFGEGATADGLQANEENFKNMLANYMGFDTSLPGERERFEKMYEEYVKNLNTEERRGVFDQLRELDKAVTNNTDKTWYNYANELVQTGKVKSFSRYDTSGTDLDYASIGMYEYLKRMQEYFSKEVNKK